MFSILKIAAIICVLIFDTSGCSNLIFIYLIMFGGIDFYELFFNIGVLCYANGGQRHISSWLVNIMLASCESFRMIISVAMSVEIIRDRNCVIHSIMGILAMCLCAMTYFKCIMLMIYALLWLCYRKRKRRELQETVDSLRQYLTPMPEGEICSICMDHEVRESVVLRCNHWFHRSCLEEWIQRRMACPMCRRPL
ncbi:unnamed protein product [Blepharisma stoltei]|uniref:RING-type domain-containing protein n=1 Tax=Blepharisma stoltei TaxID=1481888 RepID=A0AAU9IPY3_9CILI|nr:unnamed protein product [Blepharisma stoltei]